MSYAPHLYDVHKYHHSNEHVPTFHATHYDDGYGFVIGISFVILPILLACIGWSV